MAGANALLGEALRVTLPDLARSGQELKNLVDSSYLGRTRYFDGGLFCPVQEPDQP
jgi:hypothetical protein